MDRARGPGDRPEPNESDRDGAFDREGLGHAPEPRIAVGDVERRMHLRAYNYWVSLLKGRAYPAIEELDLDGAHDFGAHGVLLDFTDTTGGPRIHFIGQAVRQECGITAGILRVADMPQDSLLARMTEQYPRILSSRAPIGFEAEFLPRPGRATLYRGILMPFSSDQQQIDFVYGVINWKEVADAEVQAQLTAEIAEVRAAEPAPPAPVAAWADGPSGGYGVPATTPDGEATAAILRAAPSLGSVMLDAGGEEFVVLIGRAGGHGRIEVVARADGSNGLTEQALRRTMHN